MGWLTDLEMWWKRGHNKNSHGNLWRKTTPELKLQASIECKQQGLRSRYALTTSQDFFTLWYQHAQWMDKPFISAPVGHELFATLEHWKAWDDSWWFIGILPTYERPVAVGAHLFKGVCVCMYIYIYTHTYIYTYTYVYIYIHVYIYTYVYIYILIHMHVCVFVCVSVCVCVDVGLGAQSYHTRHIKAILSPSNNKKKGICPRKRLLHWFHWENAEHEV